MALGAQGRNGRTRHDRGRALRNIIVLFLHYLHDAVVHGKCVCYCQEDLKIHARDGATSVLSQRVPSVSRRVIQPPRIHHSPTTPRCTPRPHNAIMPAYLPLRFNAQQSAVYVNVTEIKTGRVTNTTAATSRTRTRNAS
jgi:hypothetical protein